MNESLKTQMKNICQGEVQSMLIFSRKQEDKNVADSQ